MPFQCRKLLIISGGHEVATVVPVTFASAGSQNTAVSSHVSMPDISVSIGSEENQLLQNEVDTLTNDMQVLTQRLQATQEGRMISVALTR